MIHILSKKDIVLVDSEILQAGLYKEFERLPKDYIYPEYGYFIVIETIEELKYPIPLKYCSQSHTPKPLSDYVEMIEKFDGYSQIVLILETDFGVSLFVTSEISTLGALKELLL